MLARLSFVVWIALAVATNSQCIHSFFWWVVMVLFNDYPSASGGDSWCSYRVHGDPLPLRPDWVENSLEMAKVTFPRRGAWTARALNSLALHVPNSFSNFERKLLGQHPSATQSEFCNRITECFSEAGPRPAGMDGAEALRSMGGDKCLYSEEPKNLANYDYSKVKVLKSTLHPRQLSELLPPHVKSVLLRYQTLIEKPPEECDDCPIVPYWDPKLRHSKKELVRLITGLARVGLVTFRAAVKEKIGLFFVRKKTPQWIRMVIDARRVNHRHRCPPTTKLATPRAFVDIQFPPTNNGEPLAFGMEADVNDCFYNFVTEELASWFGIDFPLRVGDWVSAGWNLSKIFDDATGRFYTPDLDLVVYPVFRGLCMGWSWSLFFANEAVAHIVRGMQPSPMHEIRDKTPSPDIMLGPVTGVYVDNISIIGRTKAEVKQAAAKIDGFFRAADIPISWTHAEPTDCFETVGVVMDFAKGRVRNKPSRIWRTFLAGQELLRRKRVPGKLVEIWLGHITSLFMLSSHALSAFFHIYRFVEQFRDGRGVLWSSVREEIRTALGLVWLCGCSIRFDPILQVDAGDSSSGAFALMTTWCSHREVADICKWRESWRFQPLPTTVERAVESGSRGDVVKALEELEDYNTPTPLGVKAVRPFGAGLLTQYADWLLEAAGDSSSWLRTSSVKSQLRAKRKLRLETDATAMVVPIPSKICCRGRFTLLWRKRWRSGNEHINIKEGRVALSSLRRSVRVTSLHGKLKVTLTDNMAALSAFDRGRSSSFALNKLCREASSMQFVSGIRWRLRHIETDRNPADRDSRFHQKLKHQSVKTKKGPLIDRGRTCDSGKGPFSSGQQQSEPSTSHRIPPKCSPGVFLEIFAGSARLSHAMNKSGLATLTPMDSMFTSDHDLRRRATQLVVLHWLRSGVISYVHFGTPCTVFSRARHGILNARKAREKERIGLELALFTAEAIETCSRCGVKWSLENPRKSRLFDLPFLAPMLHRHGVACLDIDFCEYGEPYQKATRIFTNCWKLVDLCRRCSHKKHNIVLRGSEVVLQDGKRITQPKTKAAGAYPFQLVDRWSHVLAEEVCLSSSDTVSLSRRWDAELAGAKAEKTCRRQVQTSNPWDYLTFKFQQKVTSGIKAIVFGQHSNQEAYNRQKKFTKEAKSDSINIEEITNIR